MKNLKDSKPISRRVLVNMDNRLEPRPSDYCTVTLYPSGTIGFRANRARREVILSLGYVYKIAISKDLQDSKPKRKTHLVKRGLLSTFGIK